MRALCSNILRLTGILSLFAQMPAAAQNDDTRVLLDSVTVEERVLVLSDGEVAKQSLTAEEIKRLGVVNVGEALKYVSGAVVKDYGGAGGIKTVSVRGLGAQHTAVFYDGVAVGDCQSGQVDVGRFSTDNLSDLTLSVGNEDNIYSPARMLSSAGVVSLNTHLPDVRTFKTAARMGSFDSYQASLLYGNRKGDTRYSLFGDCTGYGGSYPYRIKTGVSSVDGNRNNSQMLAFRGEVNVEWSPSPRHTLSTKIYAYNSRRGVPGAVIVDNPLSSEHLRTSNIFAQMFYEYIPSKEVKMKSYLKYNFTYDKHRKPMAAGALDVNRYRQQETDLSYTLRWQPSFIPNMSIGVSQEAFHNILHTTNNHVAMASEPRRITSLTAVSARWASELFSVTGSMLYTYTHEWAPSGDVAPDRSRFSPSLAVAFYPFRGVVLRASYKDIFRLPTFNDLYYRSIGNYKLRPEKSKMLNAGITCSTYDFAFLEEISLSVDGYIGAVEDKIVAEPGIFVWKMSNVDEVAMHGVDVAALATTNLAELGTARIRASYSYMHAVNDTEGATVKGHQIVYTPRHSGTASLAWENTFIDVGYTLLWSGKRYSLAQNSPSSAIGVYSDHSLWLSRSWNASRGVLTTRIDLCNLLNSNYEIIRYYPMPGFNFRLSVKYEL